MSNEIEQIKCNDKSNEVKQIFETKQDFIKYYNEHCSELDELKTKELNNKFKVKDHKIIRNKGKISFRKIKTQHENVNEDNNENVNENNKNITLKDIYEQLIITDKKINEIIKMLEH